MKALATANVCHNDIKPANFLADWPRGSTPSSSNLKIYLTDFGMVDKVGGTPVYCSPEGLTATTPGVSDLFSLGRVYTFLIMENKSLFYTLVFTSILDSSHLQSVRSVMSSFPILDLIKQMTDIDQNKRTKIHQVEQRLAKISLKIITKATIDSRLIAQGQTGILNRDYQVDEMMKERLVMIMTHII